MKAVVLAVFLLAGCTSAGTEPVNHRDPIYELPESAEPSRLLERRVTLVDVSGGPLPTGVVPLNFTVDDELVYSVEWEIIAAPNQLFVTGVRGGGCTGFGWGGGLAAESRTYGECDPFARGDHEIEAFFDIPVASYNVRVWGTAEFNGTV